jgi:hypothetical protein
VGGCLFYEEGLGGYKFVGVIQHQQFSNARSAVALGRGGGMERDRECFLFLLSVAGRRFSQKKIRCILGNLLVLHFLKDLLALSDPSLQQGAIPGPLWLEGCAAAKKTSCPEIPPGTSLDKRLPLRTIKRYLSLLPAPTATLKGIQSTED